VPAILCLAALAPLACSPRVAEPTAAERATRLNDAKTRAAALLDRGSYEAAISVLEPLSAEASADYQTFVMLGDAYGHLDEFDKAVHSYESALRLVYTNVPAHLKLATLLMEHERVGRALTEFELAIRYGDRQPLTHYNYGLALREMNRAADALTQWRLAFEMDPNNARYAEAVGMGMYEAGDSAAVSYFEQAAHLGAADASFHNNFGLALERAGRALEAATQFERAVEGAPDNETYRFNLAALYTRRGMFEQAASRWEDLIARYGARWSYCVYLARAYHGLGRAADAVGRLAGVAADYDAGTLDPKLVDRDPPRLDEAFEILALSYRALGDGARALRSIRRAIELQPDNLVYLNNYGVLLAESGMLDEARAQWRKVLEIDANNANARENLSRFGP